MAVARDLLNASIVADPGTADEVRARIVEVEAYLGEDDPASHAYRGPTPRSSIMFGPPGHLYVYLSYGVHYCANLVCGEVGSAAAVLLRAAALESGEPVVRARRATTPARDRLLSGPGNLCRGLAITAVDNDLDVCDGGRIRLELPGGAVPVSLGPRVGITRAADLPLRFWWTGHPAVSGRGAGATAR